MANDMIYGCLLKTLKQGDCISESLFLKRRLCSFPSLPCFHFLSPAGVKKSNLCCLEKDLLNWVLLEIEILTEKRFFIDM